MSVLGLTTQGRPPALPSYKVPSLSSYQQPQPQTTGGSLTGALSAQVGQQAPDYSQFLSLIRQRAQKDATQHVADLTARAKAEAKHLSQGVEFAAAGPLAPGAANIIKLAKKYLGTPYVWGGTTPKGFDCSGFVQWLYGHAGVKLPRTTYEQIKVGKRVDPRHLQPGDILFFGTPANPHHEALYIGHGQMIESPHTGASVRISSVRRDLVAARRPR